MADWSHIKHEGAVEDRRSMRPVVGGITLTGIAVYLLLTYISGGDLGAALFEVGDQTLSQPAVVQEQSMDPTYGTFAAKVLGSSNAYWETYFASRGETFRPPRLVLFRQGTESACGGADSTVGPHYCPDDETIYLDETFFDELAYRFGARGGDVAEAYVIAHEAGHHAQHQLGTLDEVRSLQQEYPANANDLSVKMELQADCYAGLWAYSLKDQGVFEPGEIEEAIDAARAVGDDRIQARQIGEVDRESWTHGSSTDRATWFGRGYDTGTVTACDTF